jgi:cystathionine beta-lyase/cystathionine gamma-synthase
MGETAYSNSICVCTERTTCSKAALASRPARLLWRPYRLIWARRDRGQFDVSFIDQSDEVALSAGFEKKPALILIETPSNPLMCVVDIRAIAVRAKAVGAKAAVDNTFLSLRCSGRLRLARILRSIRPQNISMAIQTCRRRRYCGRECGLGRTLCLGQYHRGTELPSTRI